MLPTKWRQSFVACEGAHIAIYEYHRDNHIYPSAVAYMNESSSSTSSSLSRDISDPSDTCEREVVVLAAGCANSVSIYDMLDEKSLPEFLYSNGFDVWALDLRGLKFLHNLSILML
jgi:hypothetical protein